MGVILGLGGYHHDAAAALVVDGRIAGAIAEERLTRSKHQDGLPHRAVPALLARAGLPPTAVDEVAVFWAPRRAVAEALAYRLSRLTRDPGAAAGYLFHEAYWSSRLAYEARGLADRLNPRARVRFVEHHQSHAAATFFTAGWDEAAILSVDAFGERVSTWAGRGRGASLTTLWTGRFPHSLGSLYSAVTRHLGFADLDDFKVMGLAPYGDERHVAAFRELARVGADGRLKLDLSYFTFPDRPSQEGLVASRFSRRFGPPRPPGAPLTDEHRALARATQDTLEEVLLAQARVLQQRTRLSDLCLAGGVSLNAAAVGRLQREGPFRRVWVQPAAGDDGTALGAALLGAAAAGDLTSSQPLPSAYLGPDLQPEDCRQALDTAGVRYREPRDLARTAARALASGRLIARATGRSEWGPRALGHRSILADPRTPEMKDRLNLKVKHREVFRPFAPAILAVHAAEYLELEQAQPHMTAVVPVRPPAREHCPAVVHVDDTTRPQTVSPEDAPGLHRWLEAFHAATGVPVLLNTSFNVAGEPIVETAADALRCFYSTGLDALALGPYWIEKPQPRN